MAERLGHRLGYRTGSRLGSRLGVNRCSTAVTMSTNSGATRPRIARGQYFVFVCYALGYEFILLFLFQLGSAFRFPF